MMQFNRSYPSATLDLRTRASAEIENWLLTSDVDLAVIANPTMSPSIQLEPYRIEKLIAFVAPNHPLARKKSVATSEFGDIRLIVKMRRKGQSRTETQLSDFTRKRIKFKTVMRYESAESVKQVVRHGGGVGILFYDTVRREIDQGEFIAVHFAGLNVVRQTYIAYSKERSLSSLAREFLSLLRASVARNASMETRKPPISNRLRKGHTRDDILQSKLLSRDSVKSMRLAG